LKPEPSLSEIIIVFITIYMAAILLIFSRYFSKPTHRKSLQKTDTIPDLQPEVEDELIGTWHNNAEDGSGLNAIWGYGIEFRKDGTGSYYGWGMEDNNEVSFEWMRTGTASIEIKTYDESTWQTANYSISDFIGAYNGKYKKLTTEDGEGLPGTPDPVYKSV
jgi:hypothetical protein